ncbi:MAG: Uma2 family endonuclease [Hormoscilla sp.]
MTQAVVPARSVAIKEPQEKEHLLTFQEYLDYEGEPDVIYELVRGKLIPMSTQTHLHTNICKFLIYKFQRYFAAQNLDLVANALATAVRTEEDSSRIPDLVVCSQTVWEQVIHRPGAGVLDFDEKPILVIEIVSSNRREDYVIKRNEYEMAEIPEYWIVDPKKKLVRVCANPRNKEGYSFVDFAEDTSIVSREFEQLVLSVKELLDPPFVEELIKEEQTKIKTLEQQAETERQQAQAERQRAENERQRAETERQRAETERQRAEQLVQRLLEMGVNPDDIH